MNTALNVAVHKNIFLETASNLPDNTNHLPVQKTEGIITVKVNDLLCNCFCVPAALRIQ